jgi:hypothetical protein
MFGPRTSDSPQKQSAQRGSSFCAREKRAAPGVIEPEGEDHFVDLAAPSHWRFPP